MKRLTLLLLQPTLVILAHIYGSLFHPPMPAHVNGALPSDRLFTSTYAVALLCHRLLDEGNRVGSHIG